ncbi:MAG: SCO family protein [Bryobacteraceae bacterium]
MRRREFLLPFLLIALASCSKRYPVEGIVLAVEPARKSVVVSHNEIPDYMDAMAMPFRVRKASEIERLNPGERVAFDLMVTRKTSYARRFRRQDLSAEGVVEDGGLKIRIPRPENQVAIGEPVPDFELTNQSGETVRLSDLRGSLVAVNFIYTRCPLPEVCPRLASHFARLQRRLRERPPGDLSLLSITLDPTYDTPEVLARYATIWRADSGSWQFLTGADADIQRIAGHFGLVYWPEEGVLTHTSVTALVGRDGRLLARVEGSSYRFNQLGDLVEQYLE